MMLKLNLDLAQVNVKKKELYIAKHKCRVLADLLYLQPLDSKQVGDK
jgi:hypothetical protein